MKAARDSGEDFYDPERKDNISGRIKTRQELWEGHLKDQAVAILAQVAEAITLGSRQSFTKLFRNVVAIMLAIAAAHAVGTPKYDCDATACPSQCY